MASVHPAGWRELQAAGAAQREIETLHVLAAQLPDTFTVYHGVHWTRLQQGFSVYGEVDFVVVAPNGRVLVIEQKSGLLEETEAGLHKLYGGKRKSIADQIARSVEALQARYAQGHAGQRLTLDCMLYCPHFTVTRPHVAGIDPGLVVDATRRDHLARTIVSILAAGAADPERVATVCRFFDGVLDLVPEIGAVSADARTL
jgi:hypothetical protein